MVLESLGVHRAEAELRELCDCVGPLRGYHELEGTSALGVVDAARSLGFARTRKYNLTADELRSVLESGSYPITYLKTRLEPDRPVTIHAVVVVGISEKGVSVLDPWRGELTIDMEQFNSEWSSQGGLTIVIE